ncbi:hypothetical protein MRB53_037403 [Persea americana]|nr:hypothetical protein MRB53_037403 [Persea americana]
MSLQRSGGHVPTGYADEIVISEATFRAAHRKGEAVQEPPAKKRKREARGDSSIVYGAGAYKGPWARFETTRPDVAGSDESGSDEEVEVEYEEDEIEQQPAAPTSKAGTAYEETGDGKETSTFRGSQEFDYQGRTYMHVPQDLDIDLRRPMPALEARKCYYPKKIVHTWKGHTKPVTQTRFFPDSGHLLLSAGADNKILLWDVYHDRELLRDYNGHSKAVADVDFTPDGTHFMSASYDRSMKYWDTETGTCISRFSTGATPHVIRLCPAQPNDFIAGMSDKKIVQFDVRAPAPGDEEDAPSTALSKGTFARSKPIQEYDHHLNAVNTLTFCDESRRFMSTSDDKSLRAWEYGLNVPIKYIAEPYMYPLVRACAHPSEKHVAYQSSDNQIVVYAAGDKFRQNRKKSFRGHNNAGYAIDVAISNDGGMVGSGDTGGYVCFWDFKTCKMWHKMLVADAPVLSMIWHPRETSKVVVGSGDGLLRLLD